MCAKEKAVAGRDRAGGAGGQSGQDQEAKEQAKGGKSRQNTTKYTVPGAFGRAQYKPKVLYFGRGAAVAHVPVQYRTGSGLAGISQLWGEGERGGRKGARGGGKAAGGRGRAQEARATETGVAE